MNRPDYARIFSHSYKIEWFGADVASLADLGSCNTNTCTIKVCDSIPKSKQAEVLLHEIAHAYFNAMNYSDKSSEESFAGMAGEVMAMVAFQNKHILEWVMEVTI